MTDDAIRETIAKLRIKSGGIGTRKTLPNGWEIGLWEPARDDNSGAAAVVSLEMPAPDGRVRKIRIGWDDLHTPGRSPWRRSNTYRLSAAGIERVMRAVLAANP